MSVEAVEELSYLANQKLGGDSRKWSLASLTENFVSKQVYILSLSENNYLYNVYTLPNYNFLLLTELLIKTT